MKQKVKITVNMIVTMNMGKGGGVEGDKKLQSKGGQGLRFNRNIETWLSHSIEIFTLGSFECG